MNELNSSLSQNKPECGDLLNALVSNPTIFDEVNDDEYFVANKASSSSSSSSVSQKLLTKAIELLVENLDLSYSDAILQAIGYFEIQLSDVKKLLAPQIIDKLHGEAVKLHLVRNDSKIEALF